MKLRNKKTEEIWENAKIVTYTCGDKDSISVCQNALYGQGRTYDSLAELNEEWEDYSPKEPLIKDKKIRKAVRAWAEANGYSLLKVGYDMASEPNEGLLQIHFEDAGIVDDDKFGVHTIAELCGEEEK